MTKLLDVAEGILDSAVSEHLETNLESVSSVQAYAEYFCDLMLSDVEAKAVLDVCNKWINDEALHGSNDYYYTVKKPLLGDDATL